MADLCVSEEMLDSLVRHLGTVSTDLANTESISADVADMTGHAGLAHKVRAFAGSWDARREDMVEAVTGVRDMVKQISEKFDLVDGELSKAFEKK